FGGWERGDVPVFPAAAAPAPAARAVYLIDKPGAAQSVIRIGHVGPPRTTPDWYALDVLNTILGGAFTSGVVRDRKSTRLNSSHQIISYAVFCLKKKKKNNRLD